MGIPRLQGLQGWTGGASDIVKAKSSGEDPRATGGLVSNLPHPRVNKTKQHYNIANPGNPPRYNNPQSGLSLVRSTSLCPRPTIGPKNRSQSLVDMLEHRDTYKQAQVCSKGTSVQGRPYMEVPNLFETFIMVDSGCLGMLLTIHCRATWCLRGWTDLVLTWWISLVHGGGASLKHWVVGTVTFWIGYSATETGHRVWIQWVLKHGLDVKRITKWSSNYTHESGKFKTSKDTRTYGLWDYL